MLAAFLLSASFQAQSMTDYPEKKVTLFKPSKIPVGNFCMIKDICVLTQSKQDCETLGG